MDSVVYRGHTPSRSYRKLKKGDRFQEELDTLESMGISFVKHTSFHIKVDDINYYSSGTVNFDGGSRLDGKGLAFFLDVLASEGIVEGDYISDEATKSSNDNSNSLLSDFDDEDAPF